MLDMAGESQWVWGKAQGAVSYIWKSLIVLFPSSGNCLLLDGIPNATKYLITCLKLNLEVESIHKSQSTWQVFFSNRVLQYFLVVFPFIHPVRYMDFLTAAKSDKTWNS